MKIIQRFTILQKKSLPEISFKDVRFSEMSYNSYPEIICSFHKCGFYVGKCIEIQEWFFKKK